MSLDNFSKKLIYSIKNKINDEYLLSHESRGYRSAYFFGLITLLNSVINYFQFKNEIIFYNKKPYIKINDLRFQIVNKYFLKNVNEIYISKADLILKFLNKFNFKPNIIIDVGACWGEYSLILAKNFDQSKVYAIEGSVENYKILCENISFELNKVKNINPYNYIVSNSNSSKYIKNIIGTTNIVKKDIVKEDANYSLVKSITLSKFLSENQLNHIDFLKLDIEGHEINLINDLLNINIKYGQIEIININSLEKNLEFLELLSDKFYLFDSENFNKIDKNELRNIIFTKLNASVAFDIFIMSK